MKKLIILVLFLSHSLLAMTDENTTKLELLKFIKENNITVGSYHWAYYTTGVFDNDNLTIEDFDNIDFVSFKDKNLTAIPSTLSILPNLVEIDIDNTNLETFPKIDNFTIIEISNIDFNKIANDIFKNTQLTELIVKNCKMTYLPNSVGNLINLAKLELENYQLTELPKEFENLVNLKTLKLTNNKIEEFPNTLVNLEYLYMKNNSLKNLPKNFKDTINLQYLDLSNNGLEELPEKFGNLIKLKYLNLSNNRLKELPESFNLRELRDLYLNNNQIKKLPKSFFTIFETIHPDYGNWRPGPTIDISNNRISFFDRSVCKAHRLSDFYFCGNYFNDLPNCLNNDSLNLPYYYIYNSLNINCNKQFGSYEAPLADFLTSAGWQFAEDIIIYHQYEDNKTIKLEPIYQIDMNIESYLWSFGDGNSSTEETPTYTYQNYGDYNVTLTINNDKTFSKLITISPRVIELKKGWNMITPPTKDDINVSIFNETWSYQNDTWENNHSYLIPTLGYWVKLSEDLNYSYNGEVYELPDYKIRDGWNFVGSGEKYTKKENEIIYQYKNSEWRVNPKEIKRGDGFWIKK